MIYLTVSECIGKTGDVMEGSLKNQAYYEIRQRILTCEYAPGAILNEAFLCEELSFSRTPVRDALSRLEHEHLLRIVSKKGIVIENITLSDIGNYFEVLLRLVQTAVQDSGKNVNSQDLLIFRQYFSDMTHLDDPYKFCSILSSVFTVFMEETGIRIMCRCRHGVWRIMMRIISAGCMNASYHNAARSWKRQVS